MDGSRFVGGAALARKRARQAKYNCPSSTQERFRRKNNHRNRWNTQRLPNKVRPSERFFASLLLCSIEDLTLGNGIEWHDVIREICDRAGAPFPSKLDSSCRNMSEFYGSRASLVLEESRCIIAESIRGKSRNRRSSMHVEFCGAKEKNHGFVALTFIKRFDPRSGYAEETTFTPAELYDLKPGCVIEVKFGVNGKYQSVLASIIPSNSDNEVQLMAYQTSNLEGYLNDSTSFCIIPVTTLISEMRQFVACFSGTKVAFALKLMGAKSATHTRFDNDDSTDAEDFDNDKSGVNEKPDSDSIDTNIAKDLSYSNDITENCLEDNDYTHSETYPMELNENIIPLTAINIPELNEAQEAAATAYLDGPRHTLSLVQGPPGTGKTQFMTAVLIRTFLKDFKPGKSKYCSVDKKKRVLVTAPTNFAIKVLSSRFIKAINSYSGVNVILIGVKDALFPPDSDAGFVDESSESLRSIFLYSWVEELIKDFQTLKLSTSGLDVEEVLQCAYYLVLKLEKGLPYISKKTGTLNLAKSLCTCLEDMFSDDCFSWESDPTDEMKKSISKANLLLQDLLAGLREMQYFEDPISELLATANIIFSTLSSSGASLMKRTKRIDELFVDEAAAATEPEILIPLHLKPRKMLAVGDPKQLPATVTSQRAAEFGLDKSLMDRLMFDSCNNHFVMLDVQYRMKPDISSFPACNFYNGKLKDGENVVCPSYKSLTEMNLDPYTFFQVDGHEERSRSGSYFNTNEAEAVAHIVQHIQNTSVSSDDKQTWGSLESIRVITFYSGQVKAIKDSLRSFGLGYIHVATVDSSQGCESDVVIVSFVRCRGKSGFLQDDRRINVALTRAKYQLICVGDAEKTLLKSGVQTLQNLVNDVKKRGLLKLKTIDSF